MTWRRNQNIIQCCAHLVQQEKNATRLDSSQQPFLFQEHLDATGTPGTQGGLLIYTPALGRAMCPPGIGQSAGTLICMHLLRRGWRQMYQRPAPSFRRRLPTSPPFLFNNMMLD